MTTSTTIIPPENNDADVSRTKKVVLITGCSSGIGLHLAIALSNLSSTFKVIATLRNVSRAPDELKNSACDVRQLDVTNEQHIQHIQDHLNTHYDSRCDILINNAGYGISGSLEDIPVDDAKKVFDVNVFGPVRLCQVIAPFMRLQKDGLIVTISSTSGVIGQPFSDCYTASKMAIEGFMESYRYTVEQDNVKVIMINPGPTNTPFSTAFTHHSKKTGVPYFWSKEIQTRNANGQDVEQCAQSIVSSIRTEMNKNIIDGKESVSFWNGTSEFSQNIIRNVKKFPDGAAGIYEARFQVSRQIVKQANKYIQHEKESERNLE